MKLGDPKNIWTGRKVTTEDIENVSALNRKAVLYNIFREISCKGETRHRYDFSGGFISFLMATGEALYRYPDLAEAHEDDGTEEADFMATMSIISRYLALKRIMERRTAGLPEWTLKSISQEITQKEITDEEALLLKAYKS